MKVLSKINVNLKQKIKLMEMVFVLFAIMKAYLSAE